MPPAPFLINGRGQDVMEVSRQDVTLQLFSSLQRWLGVFGLLQLVDHCHPVMAMACAAHRKMPAGQLDMCAALGSLASFGATMQKYSSGFDNDI